MRLARLRLAARRSRSVVPAGREGGFVHAGKFFDVLLALIIAGLLAYFIPALISLLVFMLVIIWLLRLLFR